jgi:hypothetical protein
MERYEQQPNFQWSKQRALTFLLIILICLMGTFTINAIIIAVHNAQQNIEKLKINELLDIRDVNTIIGYDEYFVNIDNIYKL